MHAKVESRKRGVKWSVVMGAAGVITLAAGLSNLGGDLFSGVCRAIGSVFFFLAGVAWVAERGVSPDA